MSNVIPFRDPYVPVIGEARDKAIAVCQEAAAREVAKAISSAFSACLRACDGCRLGLDDAVRIFVGAVRAEVAKVDCHEPDGAEL